MIITPSDLQGTMVNANLDDLYLQNAINEAEGVYLREILGDLLYNTIINKINNQTLTGKYATLVDQYIKIYLQYKTQSLLVPQVAFKIRNAGVISQFDQGFNTTSVKDTMYVQEQYDSKAEFYANRLTVYLQKNASDFPEYGYSDDNVTQPTETQNVTTIYLGGGRKKGCGCNTTPQATTTTVEWDNIQNRPNFAQVAYSNDYNDLDNKPEIPSVEGYATEEWVQEQGYSTFDGDYNSLTNKPTIPTVPTNVSAFTNDAGYTTFDGDYNSLTNKPTIPVVPTNVSAFTNDAGYLTQHQSLDGYATEEWVSEQGFSTFSGSYEDLTDKPTIPTVNDALLTIKQGGVTKGTFSANSNQNIEIDLEAGGSGSTDWSDIQNKPNFANVATSGDYEDLQNKPTIPTVPTNVSAFTNDAGYLTQHQSLQGLATENYVDSAIQQVEQEIPTVPTNVSAFTNDAGYLTQHQSLQGYATETWVQQQGYTTFDGDYNSLNNKPTIPAAQVQSDWNATSGMGEILNKPSMTAETWTFTLSNNTTVTKTVWLQPTV